jgi:uncharacterized protein YfeS
VCSQSQSDSAYLKEAKTSGKRFEFSFKTANPKAKKLMRVSFLWSPIEESAPFGNDDGSDAAYGFRGWRESHKNADPLIYLKELVKRWDYPYFDWNEMDTEKIKSYIDRDVPTDRSDTVFLKKDHIDISKDSTPQMTDSVVKMVVKSAMTNGNLYFLLGQDNAIIGTAFAQLALEGWIAQDLKSLTVTTIKRELLPVLINRWERPYRETRKVQLLKMLEVIRKSDSIK